MKKIIHAVELEDGFIFEGDKKEISKKLYYSIGYIEKNTKYKGLELFRTYTKEELDL